MHSPFKTIFRKEWKQSSVLRRVAILLMVLMPPFVIMMAESASRGWIPMFSIRSYDVTQLFMDAIPMVLVLGWALFAALFTAQAYAGDRSTGNEAFLLERPVLRTLTWKARLMAVTANSLIILVAGWLIWLGYFLYLGDPIEGTYLKLSGLILGVGLGVVLTAICGSMAATAFLDSPMIAVLCGLILAVLPVGAAVFLGGLSPFAVLFRLDHDAFPTPLITLSQFPVGMILPVLLYPAYLAVSWFALCRGEPAGRGSRVRGAKVLVPSIIGVLILFLIMAPIAVRANVNASLENGQIHPSPTAGRCVLTGGWMASGGWLLDTETGQRLHFFEIPTIEVAWSADGTKVAADTRGRSINWPGGWNSTIRVVDGISGSELASYALSSELELRSMDWIGDSLFLTAIDRNANKKLGKSDKAGEAIRFILLRLGEQKGELDRIDLEHDLPLPGVGWYDWMAFFPPDGNGEIIFALGKRPVDLESDDAREELRERTYELYKGRLDGNRLSTSRIGEIPHAMSGAPWALSRSGRYWWTLTPRVKGTGFRTMNLYDLSTGEEVDLGGLPSVVWPNWLGGDELIWAQVEEGGARLHSWSSNTGLINMGGFLKSDRLGLDTSPDGQIALITGYDETGTPDEETGSSRRTGTWLYEAGSGRVLPMETDYTGYIRGRFWTNWADPDKVLRSGEDGLYFESMREPGKKVEIR